MFYHFHFAVSLGNKASKMSENLGKMVKLVFKIYFYTTCINVIIDSIGPSIILKSIYQFLWGNRVTHLTDSYDVHHPQPSSNTHRTNTGSRTHLLQLLKPGQKQL